MAEAYIPQTGDIVTVLPNPTYNGNLLGDASIIAIVPNEYKWVVKECPPLKHFGETKVSYALYSLLNRSNKMNEGAFVDKEFLKLVYRVENPEGL